MQSPEVVKVEFVTPVECLKRRGQKHPNALIFFGYCFRRGGLHKKVMETQNSQVGWGSYVWVPLCVFGAFICQFPDSLPRGFPCATSLFRNCVMNQQIMFPKQTPKQNIFTLPVGFYFSCPHYCIYGVEPSYN